jgi:hypothetical protein
VKVGKHLLEVSLVSVKADDFHELNNIYASPCEHNQLLDGFAFD